MVPRLPQPNPIGGAPSDPLNPGTPPTDPSPEAMTRLAQAQARFLAKRSDGSDIRGGGCNVVFAGAQRRMLRKEETSKSGPDGPHGKDAASSIDPPFAN